MAVITNGVRLIAGASPVEITKLPGDTEHGFLDLICSNSDTVDTYIKVWVTTGSSPGDDDIVVPGTLVVGLDSIVVSCHILSPGEKVYASSPGGGLTVRSGIIKKPVIGSN